MMKNKSNAEKTRKLGNLISLTGSGVINYNPCDHWMSPPFLECSAGTNSLAVPKPRDLTKSSECARTRAPMVPTEIKFPAHTDAHVGAKQRPGEQQVTHTHRETLLEYSFHQVHFVSTWWLIMQHRVRLGDRSSEGARKAELLLRRCEGSLD